MYTSVSMFVHTRQMSGLFYQLLFINELYLIYTCTTPRCKTRHVPCKCGVSSFCSIS